jgi:phenylpropionate dioxygenase-like ring-hydroxylating dioxygenase large terminal subunit
VRKPLLQAETLPPWCYTSDKFYQREVERIWRKAWNFLGHVAQVSKPGDYLALEFAGVPLLIVRDKDDVVRAFANSCRHRGSALLDEGTGRCRSLICPYHSWTYNLDGTLAGAPEMQKTEDFDRSKNGLIPIRLETWGGFMFVCFDETAAPLSTWLGGLPEKLACYRPEDMVLTRRRVHDMDCNWKLFVENAKESYHIATVHKATINKYASVRSAGYWVEEPTGEYVVTFAQHENSMALLAGDAGFRRSKAWPAGARPTAPMRLCSIPAPTSPTRSIAPGIWSCIRSGRTARAWCMAPCSRRAAPNAPTSSNWRRTTTSAGTSPSRRTSSPPTGSRRASTRPTASRDASATASPWSIPSTTGYWTACSIPSDHALRTAAMETIPARRGKATYVKRGQSIRIVNTHGTQVVDTWAFTAGMLTEFMSMEHTRAR